MTIDFEDVRTLDRRAVMRSVELLREAGATDLARPTPCAGWTLADLVAHMTAQHRGFAAAAAGHGADLAHWRVRPSGPDAVARYREAAEEVLDAFAAIASPDREFALPEISRSRMFPARVAIGFHFLDYVVHSWDVAQSLGVAPGVAEDLTRAALPIAQAVPDGSPRLAQGAAFRPALPTPGLADPLDQIVALLGRPPVWVPPAVTT